MQNNGNTNNTNLNTQPVNQTPVQNQMQPQPQTPTPNSPTTNQPAIVPQQKQPEVVNQVVGPQGNNAADGTASVQEAPKEVKKFNKDAFNSEEKVIYEIKEQKQGNPLVVLFFMLILIVFIFFLPQAKEKIDALFGHKMPKFSSTQAPVVNNQEEQEEVQKFQFKDSLRTATIGDLAINNVLLTEENGEYYATFTAVNNGLKPYTFDKKYYLVLYNGDKMIYRALIHSYKPIDSFVSSQVKIPITAIAKNQSNSFLLEEINSERYPDVTLTEQEGEYDVLTCTFINNEIKYYFKNNLLEKINDVTRVEKANLKGTKSYEDLLAEKTAISLKYNEINGISSVLANHPESNYFVITNNLELVNVQDNMLTEIETYRYFKYHESSKVISFELQTQGYTCS